MLSYSRENNKTGKNFKSKLLRRGLVALAMLTPMLAVAQSLPMFGVAHFGQAQFGVAAASPVPSMHLWVLVATAILLWVIACRLKPSTH